MLPTIPRGALVRVGPVPSGGVRSGDVVLALTGDGEPVLHRAIAVRHDCILMDIPSAEMTKYAANAMLATRISFMNEIANLCEKVGANVDLVRKGIGSDARIGPSFLFPGPGYGGSCFPKDVKALVRTADEAGSRLGVLEAVEEANARQKHRLFEKLHCALGESIGGAHIAVWGLAFKPQTDDMASPGPVCSVAISTGVVMSSRTGVDSGARPVNENFRSTSRSVKMPATRPS